MEADAFTAPTSYTVEEAADVLNLTPGRVRQLLRDEHLDGTPPEPGTGQRGWRVSAESVHERLSKQQPRPEHQATGAASQDRELIASLQQQIAYLRQQLDRADERDRENRRIIAGLTQRIPQLEAPAPSESRESAAPDPSRGPVPQQPQTGAQGRPWWRRLIGE